MKESTFHKNKNEKNTQVKVEKKSLFYLTHGTSKCQCHGRH